MFPIVMRWSWTGVAVVLCAVAVACSDGDSRDGDGGTITGITLDRAFNDRSFSSPVKLVQHPTNDDRWYVVEQGGLVKTFLSTDGVAATTAADIPINVGSGEQGLLGMAFDPFFGSSGEIYLAYTDGSNDDLVLQRWVSSNNGITFTASTVLLRIPHHDSNHNGSDIMFGPTDDFLYYSTGDGGGSGDPNRNAQDRGVLLGKILRLDVNGTPPAGKTYAIPGTNPHAGQPQCNAGPSTTSPCPEIYALGFRNPWRMNFDPATGRLYVGDVGQGAQEEIDRVTNGGNFGWDCFEGELPFENVAACNSETFVEPEAVYNDTSGGDSVTGGAVYRGTAIPGLRGFYIFTDFFRGPFFAFDVTLADGEVSPLSASEEHISAFGQGRDGEVYAVDLDGPIWKIVPSPG